MADATMTLNLSAKEMAVVEELAAEQDLSKTQVIRQALRMYQMVILRLKAGETLHFSGDPKRAALFVGIGIPDPDFLNSAPSQTEQRTNPDHAPGSSREMGNG